MAFWDEIIDALNSLGNPSKVEKQSSLVTALTLEKVQALQDGPPLDIPKSGGVYPFTISLTDPELLTGKSVNAKGERLVYLKNGSSPQGRLLIDFGETKVLMKPGDSVTIPFSKFTIKKVVLYGYSTLFYEPSGLQYYHGNACLLVVSNAYLNYVESDLGFSFRPFTLVGDEVAFRASGAFSKTLSLSNYTDIFHVEGLKKISLLLKNDVLGTPPVDGVFRLCNGPDVLNSTINNVPGFTSFNGVVQGSEKTVVFASSSATNGKSVVTWDVENLSGTCSIEWYSSTTVTPTACGYMIIAQG